MHVKDGAYIRFRYLDMPLRSYHVVMAFENGAPAALGVGRIMQVADMQCGMLPDFVVAPGCREAGIQLLHYFETYFYENQAYLMGALMCKKTEEAAILKKAGFFRCPKKFEPQPFPLIVRTFDQCPEEAAVLDFDNWFFTMGDYDVI